MSTDVPDTLMLDNMIWCANPYNVYDCHNLHRLISYSNSASLNPFKPSVLFVGHRQTVQTQIRVYTDQGLHCLLTECSIKL